jgi:hypothetical protein
VREIFFSQKVYEVAKAVTSIGLMLICLIHHVTMLVKEHPVYERGYITPCTGSLGEGNSCTNFPLVYVSGSMLKIESSNFLTKM